MWTNIDRYNNITIVNLLRNHVEKHWKMLFHIRGYILGFNGYTEFSAAQHSNKNTAISQLLVEL